MNQSTTLSVYSALLFILVATISGCQLIVEKYFLPNKDIRPVEFDITIHHSVPIKVRDGIILFADVYHPITEQRVPTILVRIPYTKTFSNSIKSEAIGRFWAKRGYHVVIQGTRGRYESEGDYYTLVNVQS